MTGNNIACWWLHAAESGLTSGLPVLSINKGGGGVSKETVVLRQWGRETQNSGFIN